MTQWIAENWPYLVGGGGSLVVGLLIRSCLRAPSRADDATALADSVLTELRKRDSEENERQRQNHLDRIERAKRLRANKSVRDTLNEDDHE